MKNKLNTMKIYKIFITLLFYHFCSIAEMRIIFSLKEAQEVLEKLDENALVVFDVDETLILVKDKIRRKHPEKIIADFNMMHFDTVIEDVERKERLDSIILKTAQQELIEPESAQIVKNLQSKNIKVIALTHMHAGKYSTLESMEEWRFKQLYDLNINFEINNSMTIILKNFPMVRNSHPIFYKGILATARSCQKGEALAELLNQLQWKPSIVVFFDDSFCHIESVHKEILKLNIPCIAFHYKATEIIANNIDFGIAKFQYKYLLKHEKWLGDEEAQYLMEYNYF